jgi:ClpX C4-type zinc finger
MTETADEIVCDFCGKRPDQVRRLVAGLTVDTSGKVARETLCTECLATFMTVVALEDREWFDQEVDQIRTLKRD